MPTQYISRAIASSREPPAVNYSSIAEKAINRDSSDPCDFAAARLTQNQSNVSRILNISLQTDGAVGSGFNSGIAAAAAFSEFHRESGITSLRRFWSVKSLRIRSFVYRIIGRVEGIVSARGGGAKVECATFSVAVNGADSENVGMLNGLREPREYREKGLSHVVRKIDAGPHRADLNF